MSWPLLVKTLRDLRWPFLLIGLLLFLFQVIWAKITERVTLQLVPFFAALALKGGQSLRDVERQIFEGPGQIFRTIIGGELVDWNDPQSMLSIAFVHPFIQTVFCIWAVGRSASAIAGEIDRGTMELLLAQPIARLRLVSTHFIVDLLLIPGLCVCLLLGMALGTSVITLQNIHLANFPPALLNAAALMFAVSGYTMFFSAIGRFRWRVLSVALGVTLVQFLLNLLGQLWDVLAVARPFTVFYYYQPQTIVLRDEWNVRVGKGVTWLADGHGLFDVNVVLVLVLVGVAGYALALWRFSKRDLPAPL